MAYTEVSVSGYNASPPPDDGSAGADNEVTWSGIKTKLADPLKTAIDSTQTNITTVVSSEIEVNLYAPAGTAAVFAQTAAPTGWTKSTTHNDKALRVVTGTASSGGATAFTTVFGSGKATGAHTLDSTEIPAHTHSFSATTGAGSAHSHGAGTFAVGTGITNGTNVARNFDTNTASNNQAGGGGNVVLSASWDENDLSLTSGAVSGTSGSESTHTHSVSGTSGSTGDGGSHTHTLSLDLEYVDVIIATKDA